MLKTRLVDLSEADLVLINKDITIDEISNYKIVGAKDVGGKNKSKNLSKFQASLHNAGLGFFTPEARLTFTKLRQAFIKTLILHDFDPDCHICIKTDVLDNAIARVFS